MKHLAVLVIFLAVAVTYASADSCDKDRDKLKVKKSTYNTFCRKYQDVKKCYLKRALYTDYKARADMTSFDRKANANFSCANNCWNTVAAWKCQDTLFNALWAPGYKNRTYACQLFTDHNNCVQTACQGDQLRTENNMAAVAIRTTTSFFCGKCQYPTRASTAQNQARGLASTPVHNRTQYCTLYNNVLKSYEEPYNAGCPVSFSRDEMSQYVDSGLVAKNVNFSCATSCKKFDKTLPCRATLLTGLKNLDKNSKAKTYVCGNKGLYETYKACLKTKDYCSYKAGEEEMALIDKYIREFDLGFTCGAQTCVLSTSLVALATLLLRVAF